MAICHSTTLPLFKQTPEQIAARLADACVDRKFMAILWNTYFERFLAVLSASLEAVSQ